MHILIVVPRYNLGNIANYDYHFPLGLGYISAILKKNKFDVSVFNLNHYNGSTSNLLNLYLNKKRFDVVCTGGNALMFAQMEAIVKAVKHHKTKPLTVVGGPIITSEPELMQKTLNPDFGVIGEGEITILELLHAIAKKKDFKKVNGLIYKDIKGIIVKTSPREFIRDISKIPYPDFEGFEFEKHISHLTCNRVFLNNIFNHPRIYPILGSRGCPFNCSFCWHDMKYRARSIEDLIKELTLNIKKYHINVITLYDDCFSATKDRVYEFCQKIKRLQQKIPWKIKWSCQLMVTSVDEKILKTLKDAGCYSISYGFESYSPIVLKSMRKPITPEKIDYALKETMKAGIAIQANFILGDIAETTETAKTTIDYWKKECRGQVGLGFVQPYPGSDLYKHCIKKGIIKDKFDYIKNKMGSDAYWNMTDSMTDEEIDNLNNEILDSIRKYAQFKIPSKIETENKSKCLYALTVQCPFCKKNIRYGNCYLPNKKSFGIFFLCRSCGMRFFAVSSIQRFAYRFYPQIKAIRNFYKSIIKSFQKRRV